MPLPFLAVLGVGALVGLVGYVGYRAVKHFVFNEPWDITWKGVAASVAAGAVALPAILFGSGILAAAAGVELTPLAVGGATSIVGAVTGSANDGDDPKQQQGPPANTGPQINPEFDPFSDPATVTTSSDTTAEPRPDQLPTDTATVESSTPTLETGPQAQTQPEQDSLPAPPPSYVVEKGDTLTAIAREKGLTLAALEEANPQLAQRKLPKGYSSPWDYIRTGETIFLPSKTPGLNASLSQIGEPARVTDK